MSLRHRDSIEAYRVIEDRDEALGEVVKDDGKLYDEFTVWNVLSVRPAYQFRGGNPTKESFPSATEITPGTGDRGETPLCITTWVAEELWHELGLSEQDLADHFDIEVIDMADEDIEQL